MVGLLQMSPYTETINKVMHILIPPIIFRRTTQITKASEKENSHVTFSK